MSKTLDNTARALLEELDAEAKNLSERLQIVNASRAQILHLLGKPAKGAPEPTVDPLTLDSLVKRPAEKRAAVRKHAAGSLLPEGLNPGEHAVIGKVIDGATP
jgi:hypothetical protein